MHEGILGVDFLESPLGKTLTTSVLAAIVGILSAQLSSRFNENARKRKRWEEYHSGLWEKKFEVYSDFIFRVGALLNLSGQYYLCEISEHPLPEEMLLKRDELQTNYFYALRRVQVICTDETGQALVPIDCLLGDLSMKKSMKEIGDITGQKQLFDLTNAFRRELHVDSLNEKSAELFPLRVGVDSNTKKK